MVFAHRSALRAVTAAQTLRAAPVSRGSAQTLGRRFASTGQGYEEHKSSDLPWLLGSVGLGGPMIVYLLQSGPEKKPHGDGHGIDHISEKTGKQKEIQESKVDGEVLPDEPAAAKPPGGFESMSGKQESLSNADTFHPHMADKGKSMKGEGEPETAKLKGTVSPGRQQK